MSAVNITNTLYNVFNVGIFALSTTVGIIVGHALGAGDVEKAKDTARKMIALVFVISIGVGVVYAACSAFFPNIYNATQSAKSTASSFIIVGAIFMPMSSLCHACYYTLRAGGKTFRTKAVVRTDDEKLSFALSGQIKPFALFPTAANRLTGRL